MYLVWQKDNTILGIATTESSARDMCTEYGDSYMFMQEDVADRNYEEVTEECIYWTQDGFLPFDKCKELGYECTEPDKQYRNKKNGKIYTVIGTAINCTNDRDGQEMYMYKTDDCEHTFVRSIEEFNNKFELITDPITLARRS